MINIIGAGLAGCEAAYQIAKRGMKVRLYDMKPHKKSPAHHSDTFAELVCSNSLKADDITNACGLLKQEMRELDSLIIMCADKTKVPAGGALAVDRDAFSSMVHNSMVNNPNIEVVYKEIVSLKEIDKQDINEKNIDKIENDNIGDENTSEKYVVDQNINKEHTDNIIFGSDEELSKKEKKIFGKDEDIYIIATGPLTSDDFSAEIARIVGEESLYFHDAAAPLIDVSSIDMNSAYKAARYDKGTPDYINCPMTEDEYNEFYFELINAEKAELKDFETPKVFEGCMPVEVMANRGEKTLLFGPLKPVGLTDPKTGKYPYAVVQLRQDNFQGSLYNMVGFQTNLKFCEQKRVFSLIPALENAEFVRYGVMHKNTYINSPKVLNYFSQLKNNKNIFFAGQITGVEGYVESAMSGMVAGINAYAMANGMDMVDFSDDTMTGALCHYISDENVQKFQPMNANFGIIRPLPNEKIRNKKEKYQKLAENSLANIEKYKKTLEIFKEV